MTVLVQSKNTLFEGKPIALVADSGGSDIIEVGTGEIPDGSVTPQKLASTIEPITKITTGPLPAAKTTSAIIYDNKIYHWNGTEYEKSIDSGNISDTPISTPSGNVTLSTVASNSLVPSLNYIGEFTSPPTQLQLGVNWKQNIVYKNSLDGRSYILTGDPLGWVIYLSDGNSFTLNIQSSNGTVFKPGQSSSTMLQARLFKNGAEVTDITPATWFSWRRVSAIPQAAPNDDATWNASYNMGYKQILINVDDVYARATFFCDIISS